MNKQDAEVILDKLLAWKAVPVACLNKIRKEMKIPEKCEAFLDWFNKSPVQELLAARRLVSEEIWTGYKLLQINGLKEQEIFYAARRKMVQAFKDRYPRPLNEVVAVSN